MTRSNRVLAAATGLALVSGAAMADPASFPIEDRYDNRDDVMKSVIATASSSASKATT